MERWLLGWRMSRSAVPFFLLVDFRGEVPKRGRAALISRSNMCLGDLLDHLRMLDVEDSTLVVALRGAAESDQFTAILRAPANWS